MKYEASEKFATPSREDFWLLHIYEMKCEARAKFVTKMHSCALQKQISPATK